MQEWRQWSRWDLNLHRNLVIQSLCLEYKAKTIFSGVLDFKKSGLLELAPYKNPILWQKWILWLTGVHCPLHPIGMVSQTLQY